MPPATWKKTWEMSKGNLLVEWGGTLSAFMSESKCAHLHLTCCMFLSCAPSHVSSWDMLTNVESSSFLFCLLSPISLLPNTAGSLSFFEVQTWPSSLTKWAFAEERNIKNLKISIISVHLWCLPPYDRIFWFPFPCSFIKEEAWIQTCSLLHCLMLSDSDRLQQTQTSQEVFLWF